MRRIGANAAAGAATANRGRARVDEARSPQLDPVALAEPARRRPRPTSAFRANSRSSLDEGARDRLARRRAAVTGNAASAAGSRTTVGLRRLSMSLRPTRAYSGVTRPSQRLERRGVRSGTGMSQRAQAALAGVLAHEVAVGQAVRAADLVDALGSRQADRGRRRGTRSTSSIAIGCVSTATQRGQIITGRRSTSARIISKDRLPDPMTIDARSSTTGTPDARRMSPVSWRLRRCAGERRR